MSKLTNASWDYESSVLDFNSNVLPPFNGRLMPANICHDPY